MNFSEFKYRLGAEPRSQDPEVLRAMDTDGEFRAAADEALDFERKLEAAFSMKAPAELMDSIGAIPGSGARSVHSGEKRWVWLAAAAVFVAAVGVAGVKWYESTFYWDNVDDYIVEHWQSDGPEFLAQVDGQPDPNLVALVARYGVQISPELAERVDFVHACRTPGSRGAHMVVNTEDGPVTVIFMPEVEITDGHILPMGDVVAATLPLESGSAVIIGPNEEILTPIYAMARAGIRPLISST